MIPTHEELLILQNSLADVSRLSGGDDKVPLPEDFGPIVVVLGSSRSGSSLLFQMLADSGVFWAPAGEETPLFRANGLGWIENPKQSDVLSSILPEETKAAIRRDLYIELGGHGHLARWARRVLWQWPDQDIRLQELVAHARIYIDGKDPVSAWVDLIQRLGLEDSFYDVPGFHSRRHSPVNVPNYFFEEPPFVLPGLRECVNLENLKSKPILLKTSTHAYRLPLLRTIFPKSRFYLIVLARNPAASINGLMDGWLSNAFHSHNLEGVAELDIQGYTNSAPQGDRWWKFDLPPGWMGYRQAPLEEVCAFQWRLAYEHILSQTRISPDPVLTVKHEDVTGPATSQLSFEKIFEFLGVKPLQFPDLNATRPVMASMPPQPARWRRREEQILPLLATDEVRTVAEHLDYDLSSPDGLL